MDETLSYFLQHIMDIACETVEQDPSNAVAAEICDMLHDYDEAGTDELKQEIDGVEPPVFPGGCSTPHRQSSIISALRTRFTGSRRSMIIRNWRIWTMCLPITFILLAEKSRINSLRFV